MLRPRENRHVDYTVLILRSALRMKRAERTNALAFLVAIGCCFGSVAIPAAERINHEGRILGPAPAPLERVKKMHRYQLLIKAGSRSTLHRVLVALRDHLANRKLGSTRVFVDVDPISLL